MITRTMLEQGGMSSLYLKKEKTPLAKFRWMLPTANVAIRREVLEEIGVFDEGCRMHGEDTDLSLRIASTKWETFYDRRPIVRHRFRSSLPALKKQMHGYFIGHPYVLKKHMATGVELGYCGVRTWRMITFPFPWRASVALSSFYFLHLGLLVALVTVALGNAKLAGIFTVISLAIGYRHVFYPFKLTRPMDSLAFLYIRYVLNWTSVISGVTEGFKQGMLYLPPTRETTAL